jgi:glutamyl-tRNA reductase
MGTVAVKPELYKRVEEAAQEHKASVDEILTKAIERYLWELDRRKVSNESQVYRQQHTKLKGQYLGKYIAMHDGQVVDHDSDFRVLRQRVRQRFGRTPVMITLVEDIADQTFARRGFRLETAGQ